MEWLFELLLEILFSADVLTLIWDAIAWFKGKENRIVRREARRAGLPVPPRDGWNWSVIWLTILAIGLTGYIAWALRG